MKIKLFILSSLCAIGCFGSSLFCSNSLHEAVLNGNHEKVLWLLAQGHDPDARMDRSLHLEQNLGIAELEVTALHIAARVHDVRMIEILLRNGASVNCRDASGCTPILYAIESAECLRLLVEFGASLSIASDIGLIPIYSILRLSDECMALENIKVLFDAIERRNNGARIPAYLRILDSEKYLMSQSLSVYPSLNEVTLTPLMFSLIVGKPSICQYFIQRGHYFDDYTQVIQTFALCCQQGKLESIQMLYDAGSPFEPVRSIGMTSFNPLSVCPLKVEGRYPLRCNICGIIYDAYKVSSWTGQVDSKTTHGAHQVVRIHICSDDCKIKYSCMWHTIR